MGRSVTQIIGIDVGNIFLTMLGLVGLYLVLKNSSALNTLVKSSARAGTDSLFILQGRTPPNYAR